MKRFVAILVSGLVLAVVGLAAEPTRALTNKEAMRLAATASTPADHMRLAKFFNLSADKLEAEAKEHGDIAQSYREHPTASETKRPGMSDTVAHCESLSENLAKAAKDARALAGDHEMMAKQR